MTTTFLPDLIEAFVMDVPEVAPWLSDDPEDFSDAADCDLVSHLFVGHLLSNGVLAQVVKARMQHPEEGVLDEHWFVVTNDGIAIDWTARQFHNVAGMPLDVGDIPVPLMFAWPGNFVGPGRNYPLPQMSATEVKRWPEP